jgi:hypothetical protein
MQPETERSASRPSAWAVALFTASSAAALAAIALLTGTL